MPHRRRSLLRGPLAVLLPALLVVLACSPEPGGDSADTGSAPSPTAPRDPAAVLDAEFQRARSTLNSEAMAMRTLDRSSDEYARRYRAFLEQSAAAERLRARRDSIRRSAAEPAATASSPR